MPRPQGVPIRLRTSDVRTVLRRARHVDGPSEGSSGGSGSGTASLLQLLAANQVTRLSNAVVAGLTLTQLRHPLTDGSGKTVLQALSTAQVVQINPLQPLPDLGLRLRQQFLDRPGGQIRKDVVAIPLQKLEGPHPVRLPFFGQQRFQFVPLPQRLLLLMFVLLRLNLVLPYGCDLMNCLHWSLWC
jgi:hypothetical protein